MPRLAVLHTVASLVDTFKPLLARVCPALDAYHLVDESLLQGVKNLPLGEPFDRRDVGAVFHDGQRQARVDAPAVHQDRARPALPVVAALLRPRQVEMLAQGVEQCGPVVELEFVLMPVDGQADPARVVRRIVCAARVEYWSDGYDDAGSGPPRRNDLDSAEDRPILAGGKAGPCQAAFPAWRVFS